MSRKSVMAEHPTSAIRKVSEPIARFNGKINGVEGKTPFLIGVAGGTASGKAVCAAAIEKSLSKGEMTEIGMDIQRYVTAINRAFAGVFILHRLVTEASTVCKRIMEKLGQVDMDHTERQVVCISQDSFYRELTPAERAKAEKGLFNFDHPDAFNDELILQTLKDILAGKKCEIPVYDYRTNSRCDNQVTVIYPADVVLFEGILVFYFPEIRDLFHMRLFVDTDSDTRLARRVPRDIKERGRDLDQVLNQYMNFVKPAFEEFCSPTKKYADVIIPRGADNHVAIDLIVQHIRDFLNNRGKTVEVPPPSPIQSPRRTANPDGHFTRPH